MKAYIPSILNLGAEKHSDKLYFLLTLIYYGIIFDKRNEKDSFVQLNSSYLKIIIGGRYKTYLQHLIDLGIIESDNQYIVNVKFKGYRLTEKYRFVKSKQVEISNLRILKNISRYKALRKKQIVLPQHKYIYQCLEKVKIEHEQAKYFIESNITNVDEYFSYNASIDLIKAEDWFFVPDSTAGRVHNNITNLPKNLRQFLRYENRALIEIDIANSQPFLFNILIYRYLSQYSDSLSNSGSNIILSYVHPNYTKYPDIELYKELTSKGMFYEYLMDKLGITENRDSFKIRFFKKIFYSRENDNYVTAERKAFKGLFPKVAEIISHYKKDGYKQLAIQLQRVEAAIMINKIVPLLAKQKIYVLTIHDSFLTTNENIAVVEKIILAEFKNQYGLVPTVRIKEKK
jgi:hypothetical protein